MTAEESRTPSLPGLQYYRAAAALMVVLFHAAGVFGPTGYYPGASWEYVLAFGHSGVELFFVLSGFIICQVHWDRIGRAGELPSYIRKRLVRIYPPVIFAVLVWAAFRWVSHKPLSTMEWLNSLTLFPFTFEFAPPVIWTLVFEMAFYALFLTAFLSKRLFLVLLAAWGISGYYLCVFTEIGHADKINTLFGSAYVFLFGVGAAVFLINRRIAALKRGEAIGLALLGLVIFAVAAYLDVQVEQSGPPSVAMEIAARKITPLFGLAGGLWVLVLANTGWSLKGVSHRVLFFLGNASYAIYLWHLLPQRVLSYALGRFDLAGVAMRPIAMLLLVGVAIAVGSFVYIAIEKPVLSRVNRWFVRRGL